VLPTADTVDAQEPSRPITSRRSRVFLGMVALLPLHTVALHAWISWKPWLVLLGVLAAWQAVDGLRSRTWPWQRGLSASVGFFIVTAAASWSGMAPERFLRLLLALVVGGVLLLVTERELRIPGATDRTLRVVFWSAAAMALTAVVLAVLAVGAAGASTVYTLNDLPGIDRVALNVYRSQGMVAVTNWHQDPGYAAAWMNLWAVIAALASLRGLGSRRRWLDALVVGGLWFGVLMTLSRTGLLGLAIGGGAVLWRERARERRGAAIRLGVSALVATGVILAAVWAVDPPGVAGDLSTGFAFRFDQGLSLGPGDSDTTGGGIVNDSRGQVWPIYLDFIREHPIRGVGLGTGWALGIQEPHNIVLELLGEMGLVGLAGFTVLFVTILRSASNPIGRTALVVALSAAMTQTVLFEATWWFAAGLALAPVGAEPEP